MRHHAVMRRSALRATLIVLCIAVFALMLVLGGCTSRGPKPTPTRTPAIIVVTLTPLPPTPMPATVVQPTVAVPTLAVTIVQPTIAPPTPQPSGTAEPYPLALTPTVTPVGYPPPSS